MGEKTNSGSDTEPEECEIREIDYSKLKDSEGYSKEINEKKNRSTIKKEIMVKEISKPSRQLHVMDIARVNSIFPNDILALMPSSFSQSKTKKAKVETMDAMVQTIEVPFIKVYDVCKIQELREQQSILKNESLFEKQNKSSNLFRTFLRPKSSSNTYL